MPRSASISASLLALLSVACTNDALPTASPMDRRAVQSQAVELVDETETRLQRILTVTNEKLAASGADIRMSKIQWMPARNAKAGHGGDVIYDKQVGNKAWNIGEFVRGDSRRVWSYPSTEPNALVYSIDASPDGTPPDGTLSGERVTAAIERAMRTWGSQRCTRLTLKREVVPPDIDIGVLAYIATGGVYGSYWVTADIHHAGFGSLVVPGAIAFTTEFIFFDAAGPTDIDHNGEWDVAFREIYYAPGIPWVDDAKSDPRFSVDLETLALHETGHALSQWHFGTLFVRPDGTPSYSPRAVMNAFYIQPLRTLQGTDVGGHCKLWAKW